MIGIGRQASIGQVSRGVTDPEMIQVGNEFLDSPAYFGTVLIQQYNNIRSIGLFRPPAVQNEAGGSNDRQVHDSVHYDWI